MLYNQPYNNNHHHDNKCFTFSTAETPSIFVLASHIMFHVSITNSVTHNHHHTVQQMLYTQFTSPASQK